MFRNKKSQRNEKPAHHNEEQPPLSATRESLHAATKTQRSQKNKQTKKKNPKNVISTASKMARLQNPMFSSTF